MTHRTPPRFVPTLTEVVQSGPAPLTPAGGLSQDQLAQRVLQRVDLALDRRLREEIATVVLEQTSALLPVLWPKQSPKKCRRVNAQAAAAFEGKQRSSRFTDDLDLTLWFGRGNCDNVATR
jgi:hypothetical protein